MNVKVSIPKVLALVFATAFLALLVLNLTSNTESRVRRKVEHSYGVSDPQFVRAMGALLGPQLAPGNRAQTLLNGEQIFPAMLEAIGSARHSITFETYIYWSGNVGKRFADALSEKAKSGVHVHILVDWVGSQKMDDTLLKEMRDAGVEVYRYHPLRWYSLNRLNNRTHRKLLVVDGRVGFTGGVGIADEWDGHAQDVNHWRDTHFRIEGPVVAQMQAAFADNWMKVSGAVLHGDDYFPRIDPDGPHLAQVFKSSEEGGSESMHLMYLMSVAAAERSIDLSMAYFVPDELALEALVDALKRGVKVRIVMPGKNTDAGLVRRASRAKWGPILAAGAQMYEYEPTMYHCKVLVVDHTWTSVGSTNFDERSFRLNDEANLNIYDRDFAQRQVADFEADLKRARRITYDEWLERPLWEKAYEHVVAVLGPQL
jgi:cardiolipin synthase